MDRQARRILNIMNILQPPNDLDRQQQILLALGDLYGLTIQQVMELWGLQSYPKATVAFKHIVSEPREKTIYPKKEELIYRLRRHGLGKDTIAGDVYFLLNAGAEKLRSSIEDYNPTFHFE